MDFYQQYRHGSASWATLEQARAAGLCTGRGFHEGYLHRSPVSDADGAPTVVTGGSGSGKLTTLVGFHAINDPGRNVFNDVKGEISAVCEFAQTLMGKPAYYINPFLQHGMPNHSVHPLSFISAASPFFEADIKRVAEALVVASGSGEARFFETQARSIVEAFIKFDALKHGTPSLLRVKRMIDSILGDHHQWQSLAGAMLEINDPDITATIDLVTTMQAEGSRAFSSIMGEVSNAFAFLTISALRESVRDDARFTLEGALCNPHQAANVSLMIPAELTGVCAPFMRLIVGNVIVLKSRLPAAPRITLCLDEAMTLGRADFIPTLMTLGRGLNIKTILVIQDTATVRRLYGAEAAQSFLNSAPTQIYLGFREESLAASVSRSLGNQTLHYPDHLQRERAVHAKRRAVGALMSAGDIRAAALEMKYQGWATEHMASQTRPLATPDELLRMPNTKAIVLSAGGGCPPLLVDRIPYWKVRSNAGRFLANPFVSPNDRVTVQRWYGSRSVPIVTERVPARFAHLPQYDDGYWTFPEGYRSKS